MIHLISKLISPQGQTIYQLLQGRGPMTAKEIGKELNIFPHAVYRASKQLMDMGFMDEVGKYPVKFAVKNSTDLPITFIANRTALLEKLNMDIERAKREVNFIVSGLEVPAEHFWYVKQAIDRGVFVRKLIQRREEATEEMLQNWKKAGTQIKYFPSLEARIIIIDDHIVYFTSYNPDVKEEAIGTRFDYSPYAKIMNELFEQRWKIAEEV